jgi:hypothetical protein
LHKAWAFFDPRAQRIRNRLFQLASEFYRFYQRSIDDQTELGIHYGHSPIVQEQVNTLHFRIFHTGPSAGSHAPDGDWVSVEDEPGTGRTGRLFECFQGTHHTLLLFSGAPAGEDDAEQMIAARDIARTYGELVRTVLIVSELDREHASGPFPEVYLDLTMKLHKTYGAYQCAAYLIRPDGYVGYRCRPLDAGKVGDYLKTIFNGPLSTPSPNSAIVAREEATLGAADCTF